MFKKILYPTDFSDTAGKTIDYIIELQKSGAKEIVLLNIIHQRILDTFETIHIAAYFQDARYQEDSDEMTQRVKQERTEKITPIAEKLEKAGFKVKIRIEQGYPVKEILKVEKEEEVSAIVLGSHGRNNFTRSRLGSVAEKVIRGAASTVILVKR